MYSFICVLKGSKEINERRETHQCNRLKKGFKEPIEPYFKMMKVTWLKCTLEHMHIVHTKSPSVRLQFNGKSALYSYGKVTAAIETVQDITLFFYPLEDKLVLSTLTYYSKQS